MGLYQCGTWSGCIQNLKIAILEEPRMLSVNRTNRATTKNDLEAMLPATGCVFSFAGGARNA